MPKAKERSSQTLITKAQLNLLLRSGICDDNKKFKDVLCFFKRRIVTKDLVQIQAMDIETYKIFNTKDALREIVNNAPSEWRPKEYKGKIKKPCELCGSVKSEEKFIIVNDVNNKELLVGSSCIYKFDKIDKKIYGTSIKKLARLSKHNPEKLQRIIKFNELYGFGEDVFKEWSNKYNSFDIVFPRKYDIDFQNILKGGKRYYKKYIDGKKDNDMKSFEVYITGFNHLHKKCMKFYENKKSSKYIFDKKIAQFLKAEKMTKTSLHLQEKEEITKEFAKYICHNSFVNRFRVNIKNAFEEFNVKLIGIGEKDIKFTFKNKNYQPIELYSTLRNFVLKFSNIFYNINDFSKNDIITTLKISNSYTNVENFVSMLRDRLKRTGYDLKLDLKLYEKQQIEVHKRSLKAFATLDLSEFLDEYKECLYLTEPEAKSVLLSKIATISNWRDKSDKKKFDVGNISEKWAK